MTRDAILAGGLLLAVLSSPSSAQTMSVQSLLTDGYTVVGVMPSPAGPGVFLLKGSALVVCFVAETPNSPSVATRYCKPVK